MRALLWIQGVYILITAIWPLVNIESFVQVTGPKTDIWLVKTVGALLIPIAISLLLHLFLPIDHLVAFILGSLTSAAFISVDCYYALNDVISDIYLADAAIQVVFITWWIYILGMRREQLRNRVSV